MSALLSALLHGEYGKGAAGNDITKQTKHSNLSEHLNLNAGQTARGFIVF